MAELTQEELLAVKIFKALGDPTRFKVVQMLMHRDELGCGELQSIFGLSAPAMSHHTRVLQECGLLVVRKEGAFHFFRLRREQIRHFASGMLAVPAEGGLS